MNEDFKSQLEKTLDAQKTNSPQISEPSKKAKKKSSFKTHAIGIATGVVLGATIAFLLNEFGASYGIAELPIVFLGIFVAGYLQIIIHEGGHLIAGLISGYSFSSFRIGSFIWVKTNEKVEFKRFTIIGTGGQCLMAPPVPYSASIPTFLYNAGGVIANVIFAIISILLAIFIPMHRFAFMLFVMVAIVGLFFAILNGIPHRMGGMPNDGYNALYIKKDPNAHYALWVQLVVLQKISQGIRLKDIPKDLFTLPANADLKNPLIASVAVFNCNLAIDEMDFAKAEKIANELLNSNYPIVLQHKIVLDFERLTAVLMRGGQKAEVEEIYTPELKKYLDSMSTNPSAARVKYLYALLYLKDEKAAKKALVLFEKAAKTHPYPCEIIGEREIIAIAKNIYEENI